MALYPNTSENNKGMYDGLIGKTHTDLVVSEGDAPAEVFVVAETNKATPFIYEYGPEGNQTVLIAKGKIVEAVGTEYERNFDRYATAIQVASENSERVIGVNHHNVYDQRRDAMEGNRPTVITRNYIEVPLFEATDVALAKAAAKAMHFGAAYGVKDALQPGDYVVAGEDGNFKKYDVSTNKVTQIVGQVLGASRHLPPGGFLQYFMDIDNKDYKDFIKQISTIPSAGGDYPYGVPYERKGWKPEFEKALGVGTNKGIPFLTDGFFSAQKRIDVTLETTDDSVEAVRPNERVKIAAKDATVAGVGKEEGMVYIKLKHKINPRKLDDVKVTYEDTGGETVVVSKRDFTVDVKENGIAIYFSKNGVYKNVTIGLDAVVNPVAGIPTEWDHQGSVGALRVLLQK